MGLARLETLSVLRTNMYLLLLLFSKLKLLVYLDIYVPVACTSTWRLFPPTFVIVCLLPIVVVVNLEVIISSTFNFVYYFSLS